MAIAFVFNHPAVTSAIIGPRTVEQLHSQLAAADVTLDQATLDRIDELVTPGTTVNPADSSYANPDLEPAARRRNAHRSQAPLQIADTSIGSIAVLLHTAAVAHLYARRTQ